MKNSTWLIDMVFKLSFLILSAFTLLSLTEELPVNEYDGLSMFINESFTSEFNCSSSVTANVTACASQAVKDSQAAFTEMECESSIEAVVQCLENGFEDCEVNPSRREEYTKSFKERAESLCSEFEVSVVILIAIIVGIIGGMAVCVCVCCWCCTSKK